MEDRRIKFDVTIWGKTFRILAENYNKARSIAAHKMKEEFRKKGRDEYPISFFIQISKCVKVEKGPLGRQRKFDKVLSEVGSGKEVETPPN